MTEHETREYLKGIKILTEKRNKKYEQIDEIRSLATNCVAPLDKERIQSSGSGDRMSNLVGRLVDLLHEIEEMDEVIGNRKSFVTRMCQKLHDDRYSQWIILRFVEKNGFYDTVMKMGLTDSTGRRIDRKAISELTKVMNKEKHKI